VYSIDGRDRPCPDVRTQRNGGIGRRSQKRAKCGCYRISALRPLHPESGYAAAVPTCPLWARADISIAYQASRKAFDIVQILNGTPCATRDPCAGKSFVAPGRRRQQAVAAQSVSRSYTGDGTSGRSVSMRTPDRAPHPRPAPASGRPRARPRPGRAGCPAACAPASRVCGRRLRHGATNTLSSLSTLRWYEGNSSPFRSATAICGRR
jgi:hypothetical protein